MEVVDWNVISLTDDQCIPSSVWPSDHILLLLVLAQFCCLVDRENTGKRKRQASDDSHDLQIVVKCFKLNQKKRKVNIS